VIVIEVERRKALHKWKGGEEKGERRKEKEQ
jgi:hypothetical protein